MINLNKTFLGCAAAFIANSIFGLSFLFSKTAIAATNGKPFVLLSMRFGIAFFILLIFAFLTKSKISFKGKPWYMLLFLGLFQPVIYFICESYGIELTTATFAAVTIAIVPVASLLFAVVFLKELPSVLQICCSLLSIFGVILIALQSNQTGAIRVIGVIFLVFAIASAVGFNVISRKSAGQFSVIERTLFMFLVGFISFTIVAVFQCGGSVAKYFAPLQNDDYIISLLYLGILSSFVAFLFINYANTYLTLARATAFSNMITVVSVVAGFIIKDPAVNGASFFYCFMIIVGVWGVQTFKRKNKTPALQQN